MRVLNPLLAALACVLAIAACSNGKTPEEQRDEAVAELQSTVDELGNLSADPEEAGAQLRALGEDLEARAAAAKAAERPAVADACAFLGDDDLRELIGEGTVREPMARIGSSWGGCNFGPAEVTLENMSTARHLLVNLRPAGEFRATVDYHGRNGTLSEATGLPGVAYLDGQALLWQPPGKAWFVFVSGGAFATQDPQFALEAARRMEL